MQLWLLQIVLSGWFSSMFLVIPVSTAWPSPMIRFLFDSSVSMVSRVSGCVVVGYGSNETMFGLMKMVLALSIWCS